MAVALIVVIVDIHTHPSDAVDEAWGWQGDSYCSAERLLSLLDGPYEVNGEERRIEYAFVMPSPGKTVLTDGMETGRSGISNYQRYNREIIDEYPDRFVGTFIYNPRFGVEAGVEEFERHVTDHKHRMLKLHSLMHTYKPDRGAEMWLFPILEKAAELDVPVLMHTGDPPFSNPTQFHRVIEAFPSITFIIAHFGVQSGASYVYDAYNMARQNDNVLIETGWGHQPRLIEFVDKLGPEKFVFGTDSPPHEPGVWLRMVENLRRDPPIGCSLDPEGVEKILGGNILEIVDVE